MSMLSGKYLLLALCGVLALYAVYLAWLRSKNRIRAEFNKHIEELVNLRQRHELAAIATEIGWIDQDGLLGPPVDFFGLPPETAGAMFGYLFITSGMLSIATIGRKTRCSEIADYINGMDPEMRKRFMLGAKTYTSIPDGGDVLGEILAANHVLRHPLPLTKRALAAD